MFGSIIKSILPQAKGYLGDLDQLIVERLKAMKCDSEA